MFLHSMCSEPGHRCAMKHLHHKLIPIPREQLEQLLKDAGSTQTVEQFVDQAAIRAAMQTDGLYKKRAKAAGRHPPDWDDGSGIPSP